MIRRLPLTIAIAGLALVGAACSDDGTSKATGRSDAPATDSAAATGTTTPAPGTVPTAVDPAADTPIAPGTYLLPASGWSVRDMTITLPAGWAVQYGHVFGKHESSGIELAIYAVTVDEIFADPCKGDAGDRIALGDRDLGGLLLEHADGLVSGPEDAIVSGLPAQRYDFAIPEGYDLESCTYSDIGVQIWHSTSTDKYFVNLPDATASAYIFDVDGRQQVVLTQRTASASAENLQELDAILESIRIAP